jgi:hypothetical protein
LESILLVLWFIITLWIDFSIIINIENNNYKTGSLIALKDFLVKLFYGKNLFGIVLSIIVLVIAIPAMLLILMVQIIFYIFMGVKYVWELGNKKK